MNNNTSAKTYFGGNSTAKLLAVLRIAAALLILVLAFLFIAGYANNFGYLTHTKFVTDNSDYQGDYYYQFSKAVTKTYDNLYLSAAALVSIPLFALAGLGVVWAVSFFRASSKNGTSAFSAPSAISLSFSLLILIAYAALLFADAQILGYAGEIRRLGGYINEVEAIPFIISLVLLIIAVISTILTAAARGVYYRAVNKSLAGETASAAGATFYIVMKIINAVCKIVLAILTVVGMIALFNTNDVSRAMEEIQAKGIVTTFFVVLIVTFVLGAVCGIIEAIITIGYNRFVNGGGKKPYSETSAPYSQPAYDAGNYYAAPASYPAPRPVQPAAQPATAGCDDERTAPVTEPQAAPAGNICPSCGSTVKDGARFCAMCGHRMDS